MVPFPPHSHDVEVGLNNGMHLKAPLEVWVAAILGSLPQETVLKIMAQAETIHRNTVPSLEGNGMKVSTTENIWKKLGV